MWLHEALQLYSRSFSQDRLPTAGTDVSSHDTSDTCPKQKKQSGLGNSGVLNLELNTQPETISGVPQVCGATGAMVTTKPEVMSSALTQAEDVKSSI